MQSLRVYGREGEPCYRCGDQIGKTRRRPGTWYCRAASSSHRTGTDADVKVVVTGGAGFIGSHVADAFVERGDEVLVVDDFVRVARVRPGQGAGGARHRRRGSRSGGFRRLRARIRPHLAAQASVTVSVKAEAGLRLERSRHVQHPQPATEHRARTVSPRPAARSTARGAHPDGRVLRRAAALTVWRLEAGGRGIRQRPCPFSRDRPCRSPARERLQPRARTRT